MQICSFYYSHDFSVNVRFSNKNSELNTNILSHFIFYIYDRAWCMMMTWILLNDKLNVLKGTDHKWYINKGSQKAVLRKKQSRSALWGQKKWNWCQALKGGSDQKRTLHHRGEEISSYNYLEVGMSMTSMEERFKKTASEVVRPTLHSWHHHIPASSSYFNPFICKLGKQYLLYRVLWDWNTSNNGEFGSTMKSI